MQQKQPQDSLKAALDEARQRINSGLSPDDFDDEPDGQDLGDWIAEHDRLMKTPAPALASGRPLKFDHA